MKNSELVYAILTYLIIALLSIALFIEFYNKRWTLFFVSLLAFVFILSTFFFQKKFDIRIPPELEIAIVVFIYGSIYLGEISGFYTRFFWWDALLHTISGFVLGIVGFGVLYVLYKNNKLIAAPSLVIFLVFCFAMTIGVIWEMFEFLMDTLVGLNMQRRETGVIDTMYDFIANSIGAGVASVLGYLYLKKGESFLYSSLTKFFEENNPSLFKKTK